MQNQQQTSAFTVNPNFSANVFAVGEEKTPVVVLDDFALAPERLRAEACSRAKFSIEGTSAYPGIRAPLAREQVISVLNAVYQNLYQIYGIPRDLRLKPQNAVYSLISTPESELKTSQSLPHYDSCNRWYFALTHFLGDGQFGGTGLFRHRPTGFENIHEKRVDAYVQAGEAFIAQHGSPPFAYIRQSSDQYELYDQIEYRSNRLVIYPGSLLHSGLINPARDIDDNPASGRLTANLFIDFQ